MNSAFFTFLFLAPNRGFFCVTKQGQILRANKPHTSLLLPYL